MRGIKEERTREKEDKIGETRKMRREKERNIEKSERKGYEQCEM